MPFKTPIVKGEVIIQLLIALKLKPENNVCRCKAFLPPFSS